MDLRVATATSKATALSLGSSLGLDSSRAAPVIVAYGIVLGSDYERRRKVAAVKRSCKPAATPQGFPASIQPQLDSITSASTVS